MIIIFIATVADCRFPVVKDGGPLDENKEPPARVAALAEDNKNHYPLATFLR
jgi:hypothetical protein